MGMSTLSSSVAYAHESLCRFKIGGGLGKCRVSVLVHISAVDRIPRSYGKGVVVTSVSTRNWILRNRSKFLSCGDEQSRLKNGAGIVHGLGRSLGLSIGRRGKRSETATQPRIVICAAGDQNGGSSKGDDPVETLFMRELRRRGISADAKDVGSSGSAGTDTKTKPEDTDGSEPGSIDRSWSQGGPKTKPPPQWTAAQNDEQLKRSLALNSEGLEGLIPRATELLKLGGSFWIVFWPFILASLATFVTLYVYFGSTFLHTGGSVYPEGRPPYIEPYQLLEEESIPSTIGPDRVPFRSIPSP